MGFDEASAKEFLEDFIALLEEHNNSIEQCILDSNIDRLKTENELIKVFYPNMSACGGGLYGYYQGDNLILISSNYGAELGYSSKTVYLKEDKIVKIMYCEHYAEWVKYEEKFPKRKPSLKYFKNNSR